MSPKNPAAVALGRRGGKARVQNQTPEQRAESARRAAEARWAQNKKKIEGSLREINEVNQRLERAAEKRAVKKKATP